MPRPKAKHALSTFFYRAHPLDSHKKRELLLLLGFAESAIDAGKTPGYEILEQEEGAPAIVRRIPTEEAPNPNPWDAILDVENALGLGREGIDHLNNIPRPADYKREFRRARNGAISLLKIITGWSDYYRGQFQTRGHSINDVELALGVLFDVCNDVEKAMSGESSKGARKETALRQTILQLRGIFKQWYCGPRGERDKRGAFKSLAPWERAEHDFIKSALCAARLIPLTYRGLPRRLRDPRCILAAEPSNEPGPVGK